MGMEEVRPALEARTACVHRIARCGRAREDEHPRAWHQGKHWLSAGVRALPTCNECADGSDAKSSGTKRCMLKRLMQARP